MRQKNNSLDKGFDEPTNSKNEKFSSQNCFFQNSDTKYKYIMQYIHYRI
jgi:hypothetical protein